MQILVWKSDCNLVGMQNSRPINELQAQLAVATNSQLPSRRARVVIVGAGLAGLAAAQRLHESGVGGVVILDALDRVGGRVHTVNHSDYLLELVSLAWQTCYTRAT